MPHAVSTIQSLRTELSTDLRDRRLRRCGEHGDERHQADTDHQRRRRRRRATRVARRVLAGRSCPPSRGSGAAVRRSALANGRAMTGPSTATPTNTARAPRPTGRDAATGQAHGDERRTEHRDDRADDGAAHRRAGAVEGHVAHAPRSVPPSPARRAGRYAASTVTTVPTTIEIDDRARASRRCRAAGSSKPKAVNACGDALGRGDAGRRRRSPRRTAR